MITLFKTGQPGVAGYYSNSYCVDRHCTTSPGDSEPQICVDTQETENRTKANQRRVLNSQVQHTTRPTGHWVLNASKGTDQDHMCQDKGARNCCKQRDTRDEMPIIETHEQVEIGSISIRSSHSPNHSSSSRAYIHTYISSFLPSSGINNYATVKTHRTENVVVRLYGGMR